MKSQLSFQVGGKLIKRYVELGSIVHAGDALMQIDSRDLQQVVNSNVAATYSAESQLKLAENNLNRYQQLYSQGAISQAQLDQYQSAYEVARASAVQAGAQYSQGANQLGYSVLYADKDGVVSNINAEVGQVVGAGQAVVTLVQDGEREVEINVPEKPSGRTAQSNAEQNNFLGAWRYRYGRSSARNFPYGRSSDADL